VKIEGKDSYVLGFAKKKGKGWMHTMNEKRNSLNQWDGRK